MKSLGMSWLIKKVKLGEASRLRQIRLALIKENPKTFGILYDTERRKPVKYFENEIKRYKVSDAAIFFLEVNGEIVGMAKVGRYSKKDPYTGYLSSMGILKKYHGRGFGERLLKHRLDWIRKNTGFKKVLMIVVDGNEKMTYLAYKMGFKEISHSSFYGVSNTKLELKI